MALIWSDATYGTGVPEIDAQHQALFAHINELLETSVLGHDAEHIGQLLEFLDRYVKTHFACEERIMARRRCSACALNQAAHRRFREELAALRVVFQREGASPAFIVNIQSLLVNWLSQHIIKVDRALLDPDATNGSSS